MKASTLRAFTLAELAMRGAERGLRSRGQVKAADEYADAIVELATLVATMCEHTSGHSGDGSQPVERLTEADASGT